MTPVDTLEPHRITSVEQLRAIFPPPSATAARKQIDHLDDHCRNFLTHCPFVAMGTTNPDGTGDVSPKGGPAGFMSVLDDHHLAWGELPGNNRLDGYTNLVRDSRTGLLCLVPGIGETLRINGNAKLTTDPALLQQTAIDGKLPKIAVVVHVTEVFIHCAKAIRRSSLWTQAGWPDTTTMTKISCMFVDHARIDGLDPETIDANLDEAYAKTLWNK
jgi:uncharacterized protein